ncbi:hypothetical protein ACFLSJ_02065 [Verrucomicrobiota bacterium]
MWSGIARTAALAISALGFAGCAATGYLVDRGRDAADVFTVTLGAGSGAKVRVGPLQVAAFENTDLLGIRAGQGFLSGGNLTDNREVYAFFPLLRKTDYADPVVTSVFSGGTGTTSDYRDRAAQPHSPLPYTAWGDLFGSEVFGHGRWSSSSERGKNVAAQSPLPVLALGMYPPYYTQVEAAAGLCFSLRLGFNAGELLDFVLGWLLIDLYTDDIE